MSDVYECTLSPTELRYAIYAGRLRHHHANRMGYVNRKVMDGDAEELHIEGTCSELAFCRLMNVYPRFEPDQILAEDARLPNGLTVDVKVTALAYGNLLVEHEKQRKPCNIYALMIGSRPTYHFVGWAWITDIMIDERWDESKPKPCWMMPRKLLESSSLLKSVGLEPFQFRDMPVRESA